MDKTNFGKLDTFEKRDIEEMERKLKEKYENSVNSENKEKSA